MVAETHIKQGSSWRKAKEIHVKQGSVWHKCKGVWEKQGSAWRKVFEGVPLSVAIPSSRYGSAPKGQTASVTIAPTVTGGSAPYTYIWIYVADSSGIHNSSIYGSTLTLNGDAAVDIIFDEIWRLQVTDAAGSTAHSANCKVQLVFGIEL